MRYYFYTAIVAAILLFAIPKFSREAAIDKYGTTMEQALTIERVRADLVEIASAENENITVHSQCLDLDDLIASKGLLRDLREHQGCKYGHGKSFACGVSGLVSVIYPQGDAGEEWRDSRTNIEEHFKSSLRQSVRRGTYAAEFPRNVLRPAGGEVVPREKSLISESSPAHSNTSKSRARCRFVISLHCSETFRA
jgi:hypothetical protein